MLVHRMRPKEVAAKMNCSVATARARMRQMVHTEKPLTVTETEFDRWYTKKLQPPINTSRKKRDYVRRIKQDPGEKFLISRHR